MKITSGLFPFVLVAVMLALFSCTQSTASPTARQATADGKPKKTYADVIIGFAQLGAESEWRVANTKSIKETADNLGIELRFSDAQQKQEKQIEAVRKFIIQKVDVIGISPIVETGWTEVFQEAKAAGIPIILVDRRADVPEDLYATYLGSNFLEEGRNAARVMAKLVNGKANLVELVGTLGSAPANDRYKGFREVLKDYPGMRIIGSESGDFTHARGKEVMAAFLQKYGNQINAVYAHNDDMAIGAIEAVKAAGLKPGDLKIISVDGTRGGFQAMVDGWVQADVECNPLLGPQVFDIALKLANGEQVTKEQLTNESVFYPDKAAELLPTRQY